MEESGQKSNESKQSDPPITVEDPSLSPFLGRLPSSELYYRSYMHKDNVQFVASSTQNDFFITMSVDGAIKFWHRTENEIEFVKKIGTKSGSFHSYSVSYDGKYIATGMKNGRVFVFDIPNFDLVNRFDFKVADSTTVCFFYDSEVPVYQLGITFSSKPDIIIVDILERVEEKNPIPKPMRTIGRESSRPISLIAFNVVKKCAISVDADGVIELWNNDGTNPTFDFNSTFQTDFYVLAQNSLSACSIAIAKPGNYFALCCSDWAVRVFDFNTGKIVQTITEVNENKYNLDKDDYDSRVVIERQYLASNSYFAVDFDDSGNIIAVPSMFGLKFISVQSGDLLRIIGRVEKHERFNSVSLLQNEYPMGILTAFDKQRFYLFTTKPPESFKRDVVNEKTVEKTSKSVKVKRTAPTKLPTIATLHTSYGSIKFEMYPDECPLTVENFVTHAKRGYFDNIKFHRVVRDFCVQTGDPTGLGTGGESIWGKNIDDEILPDGHTFDEAGMVGMANYGKNTNASQFFITTRPAPNLNGSHTCWGKVIEGMENVKKMELVDCDMYNHPRSEIKLVNITFN